MSVRLTVIGSSPAWPNPGSAQSGYLLEGDEGRSLLLDCGPGVLGRLRESGPLDIEAIAITHFHLDHWGDLVPWAWLAAHGKGAGRRPELWLPPGGGNQLATFATFWGNENMFEQAFDLREYHPAREFEAAGFRLEAHRVPHYTL
jgi:ribonuclease BN (tRNA processing enzyme)